jgi:type IV pilus assembly protein PilW
VRPRFVNPTTPATLADLACRTATPAGELPSASIALFAETDTYNLSGSTYQGFDCVGESSIPMGGVVNETRSYFVVTRTNVQTPNGIVRMGQLTCVSDRTTAAGVVAFQAQPLIPGVEQLAFTYLLPSAADPNTAQAAQTAAQVTAGTVPATQWPAVLAVEVCVLTKSIQPGGNDTGTAYTDCYGNAIAAVASESYRTFRTTVRLRNRTST